MVLKIAVVVAVLAVCTAILTSCGHGAGERYKLICAEGLFENVKSSYKASQTVKVYFPYVASDTDYTFYLDGTRVNGCEYDAKRGYVITFVMPPKDVELTVESKNTMENPYHVFDEATTLITFTETVFTPNGDEVYRITVTSTEDEGHHRMTVCHPDGREQVYEVPMAVFESCYNYTVEYAAEHPSTVEDAAPLEGKRLECSVYTGYGDVVLSTDGEPAYDEGTLRYLQSMLEDYIPSK